MARLTGASAALLFILSIGAQARAAGTGMLYVKSDPPGAIVTIGGEVRGKTPVLVRGLPPGEVAVEVSLAGAEAVVRTATVEAFKVVMLGVDIEIPSATLTVISDPLEAVVLLGTREEGKTPVTIEHLAAGRHQVVLLKPGFPRTARSVVLEAGEVRVLEVKLGTGGEPEDQGPVSVEARRPEPAAADVSGVAPGRVPAEVEAILTMLKDAVTRGEYAATRRNLGLALTQPDLAAFREEVRAALRVVRALEARHAAIMRGAEALVGKEVALKTRAGARKGRVEDATVEGIVLVSKIVMKPGTGGRAAGEARSTVRWSYLALEESSRLAESWRPGGDDGAVARAIVALACGDTSAATRAARAAVDHALARHLWRAAEPEPERVERDPTAEWSRIEKRCAAKLLSVGEALALEADIRAYRKEHGTAARDVALRRRMDRAGERAKRASGLVAHWTFDEGEGAVARDSSGYGNDGRILGAARTAGKFGGCLEFDGVDDHVVCGNRLGAIRGGSCTFSAWVKMASMGRRWVNVLSNKTDWRHANGYELQVNPATSRITLMGGGTDTALARVTWDMEWHHVAATVDGRVVHIYFDGVEATTEGTVGSLRPTRTALHLGQRVNGDDRMHGLLDDIRVYGRALLPAEIRALAGM